VIVLDTPVAYALLDGSDRRHSEAARWYETADEDLVTTPLVLAELDHLAMTRAGPAAARAFHRDLAAGAYVVEWWEGAAPEAVDLAESYADLGLGLTDASLVALCARYATTDIATFDERHFRAVRPLAGGAAFRLITIDIDR
jgi:predicted nucleic acid-binding protein